MKKSVLNSMYLVAQYLVESKKERANKSYIHNMKRVCKANNIGDRVMKLRNTYEWKIDTIKEGIKDGKVIYFYKLVKVGKMPSKFNVLNQGNASK